MLTLETLRQYIPAVQSGNQRLREEGQEAIVKAASGLLWKWAIDEHRRAASQFGALSVDDVHGTLMAHFVAALDEVDIAMLRSSATNYLYHKTVSRARREIQSTNGNFKFSLEFLENSRRAKAIEGRLTSELGRQPSDSEIIEASALATPGMHLGAKDRERTGFRKPLTESFMRSWRQNSVLLEMGDMPDENVMYGYGQVRDENEGERQAAVRELFKRTAARGNIGEELLALLFLVYGVGQGDHGPMAAAQAAEEVGMSVTRAQRVVGAWVALCRTPGSPFHAELALLSQAELTGTGMVDVLAELGTYKKGEYQVPAWMLAPAAKGDDKTAAATSMSLPSK